MSDSPFRNTSIDKLCCPDCRAPAMSIVWEPAAPFTTVRIGCSGSCGLVRGMPQELTNQNTRTLDSMWRFGMLRSRNADFKSKSEREGQSS